MTSIYDVLPQSSLLRPASDPATSLESGHPGPAQPTAPTRDASRPATVPGSSAFPVRVLRTTRRPPWEAGRLP